MKFEIARIFGIKKRNRIHLDYAATTPVHTDVLREMLPYFNEEWANPSALYREGVHAKKIIENMRLTVARLLRVRPTDIIFTSGGTESNNLAIIGYVESLHEEGKLYEEMEIISTRIEHPSILETLKYLEKRGVRIVYVPVDTDGKIIISEFEKLLHSQTVLVTFAYVNSEIGVIQDVKKITRKVRLWNDSHKNKISVHLDASQAPLWLSCEVDMLGVDMMTLDSGKCYGPKGVGVLVKRHQTNIISCMFGGEQEHGLRAGTENTVLIVGCVTALVRAQKEYMSRSTNVSLLREYFFSLIASEIPQAITNGSRTFRVANNINISLPHFDTEYAVIWLDARGISASTKSACSTVDGAGSRVVHEITKDSLRAESTIRFTLGEDSTRNDVEKTVFELKAFINTMKN